MPSLLWKILSQVLGKVGTWMKDMASKAKEAGSKFLNNVINLLKTLPSKAWNAIKGCVDKVKDMGANMLSKAKEGMTKVVNGVTSKLKETVSKVKTIGGDIVKGIWNGINDKVEWIKSQLVKFKDAVLKKLKSVFGIASPSKVMKKEVGVFLAEGVAEGISDSDAPVKAIEDMNKDILGAAQGINGVTLNRQLNHTFRAEPVLSSAETGILGRLDNILTAIERGKIIAIDGEALVGATLSSIDKKLGQQQLLTARGSF
jgi:phage-related protein